jgi:hypothetical protein
MSRGGLLLRCVKENSELEYMDAARLSGAAVMEGGKKRIYSA